MKAVYARLDQTLDAHCWGTVFLGNHDNPRCLSRFGDPQKPWRVPSAKLLATMLLTLQGTPFIYQGDEIGMTYFPFKSIEAFDDIEVRNAGAKEALKGEVAAPRPSSSTAATRTWRPTIPAFSSTSASSATRAASSPSISRASPSKSPRRRGSQPAIWPSPTCRSKRMRTASCACADGKRGSIGSDADAPLTGACPSASLAAAAEAPVDQAYFSTFAALAGTIVGGLTSFGTAWVTQSIQARNARIAAETARRSELYGHFMDELALLFSHALRGDDIDYAKLVNVFALRGRITLASSPEVVANAEQAVKFLVDLYIGPKRSPQEVRAMMDLQSADAIGEFARLCRAEFQGLGLG